MHWSFLRVDEVVPTADISHGGETVAPFGVRNRSVLDVPVVRMVSRCPGSVAQGLPDTCPHRWSL
jgi:hypothetical protein